MSDCIFCKIANKEVNTDMVYEDEKTVVFKDKSPEAPIHLLVVPKEHIESIKSEGSEEKAGNLITVAKKVAKDKNLKGYKLVFNVGREGGQTIDHLHLHLLAGYEEHLPS